MIHILVRDDITHDGTHNSLKDLTKIQQVKSVDVGFLFSTVECD